MAPQILVDVDHSMQIMTEETFGPVVGVLMVPYTYRSISSMYSFSTN